MNYTKKDLLASIYGYGSIQVVRASEEHLKYLETCITTLTPTEQFVITSRFGFVTEGKTLKEIGDFINISTERVRQIEARAIRKLKHPTRLHALNILLGEDPIRVHALTVYNKLKNQEIDELSKVVGDLELYDAYNRDPESRQRIVEFIENYGFSARTYNCLKLAVLNGYVTSMKELTHVDSLKIKNFGRKSKYELKEALWRNGYKTI